METWIPAFAGMTFLYVREEKKAATSVVCVYDILGKLIFLQHLQFFFASPTYLQIGPRQ
jgi:hypothetical protein